MHPTTVQFTQHVLAALLAGALIGTERSFHGRAAGFRTHTLVAMASSMLMHLTVAGGSWFTLGDAVRMDPTRTAQGIMTGIGFLGAGVIFKEGLSVRGLTTAASIWTTAAVGILMGVGFYLEGALATALTLGVLSIFRQIERLFPTQRYGLAVLRFGRDSAMAEAGVRELLAGSGFKVVSLAYQLDDREQVFEYQMTIRTVDKGGLARLAASLRATAEVRGFSLTHKGD
jgi:putative Mg2+ transporter-C (MgtC) family protein